MSAYVLRCDEDCFNCKYPDCIWSPHKAVEDAPKPKTNSTPKTKSAHHYRDKEKAAAYSKAYYQANKARKLARKKAEAAEP